MSTEDDDFLENKSFNQHRMLMLGGLVFLVFLVGLIGYYIWRNFENKTNVILAALAIGIAFVLVGGWVVYKFIKLSDIPTHLDIRKEKVRVRYNWGEEVFGTTEVLVYVGTKDKTLFGNRINGLFLQDGTRIKLEYMDTDFVDDLLALARKNKTPLKKTWMLAKTMTE